MHRTIVGLAAVAAMALPTQALAQEPVKPPKFYFACNGTPDKVQQQGAPSSAPRSWSATAPAASFQSGAGCGQVDNPGVGTSTASIHDGVFGGTFGGAFTTVNVELHDLVLGQARLFTEADLNVRLSVNGVTIADRDLLVTPELSSTGATEKYLFSIDQLNVAAGLGSREIILTVSSVLNNSAWVWGASEVPASVEFIPPVETSSAVARKAANRRAAAKRRASAKRRAARARQ